MKLGHRLAAAVGVLALASTLAVVDGPAHAATTKQATVTLTVEDYSNATHPRYGDYVSVTAEAETPDDCYIESGGTVQIQALWAGSSTWTNVGTPDTYTYYSVDSLKKTVSFRAVFSQGSGTCYDASYNETAVTFPAQTTPAKGIGSLDRGEAVAKQSKHKVCYKVGPKPYKNKPIKYYAKVGKSKKWRYDGSIRTNKKSEYCYKIHKTKVKKHTKYKGPKIKAFKTVYVKAGGMKKSVEIDKY